MSVSQRLAELVLGHRRVLTVIVLVLTGLALFGVSRLEFNGNPRDTYQSGGDADRFLKKVLEQFGSDDQFCLLALKTDRVLTPERIAALRIVVREVQSLDGVAEVASLVDERFLVFDPLPRPVLPKNAKAAQLADAEEDIRGHPLASHFLDSSGTRTLLIAKIAGRELTVEQIAPVAGALKKLARRLNSEDDFEVLLTGLPVIREQLFSTLKSELSWFYYFAVVLAGGLAAVIFRKWAVMVAAALASGMGGLWTLGWMGLIGQKVNPVTTVVPLVIVVVGMTDAVHVVVAILRARRAGKEPEAAARSAIEHVGMACVMTSLTTAIGFGSLTLTSSISVRELGYTCAIGAVLTLVSVLSIIPLLMCTRLGKHISPPREHPVERVFGRLGIRWVESVLRHRVGIVIGGFVLFAVLIAATSQLKPEATVEEVLPANDPANEGLRIVDRHFGGMQTAFVVIEWDGSAKEQDVLKAIAAATQICRDDEHLGSPFSLTELHRAVPPAFRAGIPPDVLRSIYRPDVRRAIVSCRVRDLGAEMYIDAIETMEGKLEDLQKELPGFEFRLTGTPIIAANHVLTMITDLARSLAFAMGVIFFVLLVMFRSLRLSLIAVLPNALPLVAAGGALLFVGEPLRITSVIVFTVCLGIAVDDTIHFINRYRHEIDHADDPSDAVRRSFTAVNSALLISTLVLVTGFAAISISEMPHNRIFASLSCLSLTVALLGDLTVLPAMLVCFSRRENRAKTRE